MRSERLYYVAGLVLCLLFTAGPALAQDLTGDRQAGGTAYYTFARPGQNTIEVLVLGGQSGIYEIGEDVNLGQLMALSGGGGRGGSRSKVKVYLYRLQDGERRKILEEEIGNFAERPQYPSLQEGDVVRIETRERLNWRDALRVTTTVLSLTLTILTLFDVNVR
jgi:protein involved in polysaccharide export with SLBB domain